jgi:hypothetical protein
MSATNSTYFGSCKIINITMEVLLKIRGNQRAEFKLLLHIRCVKKNPWTKDSLNQGSLIPYRRLNTDVSKSRGPGSSTTKQFI